MIWLPIEAAANIRIQFGDPANNPVTTPTRETLNKTGVVSWYETTGEL